MKKVPFWIRDVINISQKVMDADTCNAILNELISGKFDYNSFVERCREIYQSENAGFTGSQYDLIDYEDAYNLQKLRIDFSSENMNKKK